MHSIQLKHITPPSVYWQSFKMLYNDLEESFRYVHPSQSQMHVFSLRFYELFLRASTEFESICKETLLHTKLSSRDPHDFNIKDYYLLNAHFQNKPSQISVGFLFDEPNFIRPLDEWKNGHSLQWYQEYNAVKHNRKTHFEFANLENVLLSISALFIMIERRRGCPQGFLGTIGSGSDAKLIRQNDEWPVILIKHYKNTSEVIPSSPTN